MDYTKKSQMTYEIIVQSLLNIFYLLLHVAGSGVGIAPFSCPIKIPQCFWAAYDNRSLFQVTFKNGS